MPYIKIEIEMTPDEYLEMKVGEDKLTDEEIAKMFAISSRTLLRWKRENGIKSNRSPEQYFKMKRKGMTDTKIAEKLGIDRVSLYMWKRRKGII